MSQLPVDGPEGAFRPTLPPRGPLDAAPDVPSVGVAPRPTPPRPRRLLPAVFLFLFSAGFFVFAGWSLVVWAYGSDDLMTGVIIRRAIDRASNRRFLNERDKATLERRQAEQELFIQSRLPGYRVMELGLGTASLLAAVSIFGRGSKLWRGAA